MQTDRRYDPVPRGSWLYRRSVCSCPGKWAFTSSRVRAGATSRSHRQRVRSANVVRCAAPRKTTQVESRCDLGYGSPTAFARRAIFHAQVVNAPNWCRLSWGSLLAADPLRPHYLPGWFRCAADPRFHRTAAAGARPFLDTDREVNHVHHLVRNHRNDHHDH